MNRSTKSTDGWESRPYLKAALLLALLIASLSARAQDQPPGDDAIRQILRQRIDEQKRSVAIVVGWVDEHGSRVVSYGRTRLGGGTPVNGRTVFEIGSVSKVFTSLLLAIAVEKGEVKPDDPVAKFLPPEAKIPARNGKQITLQDLATHRSGLPPMPANFAPKDDGNPYSDYTPEQMDAFLSGYTLTRDIGAEYEYSNLGVGLLGNALALRAGKGYEALLRERICAPLGMNGTWITLPKEPGARLAAPYKEDLSPTKNWDLPTFAGAGGIRSDAEDMLRFLSAELGLTPSPLAAAMKDTQQRRNGAGGPGADIALGWHLSLQPAPTLVWHNGATGGYRSFVGFDPARRCGVVVLANSANTVDDIGFHLLNAQRPLNKPSFTLPEGVGDQYVGHYEFVPGFVLHVTRRGNRYFAQATGQGEGEIMPESEAEFSARSVKAGFTFVRDAAGQVASVVLHQNGLDQSARRMSEAEGAAIPAPTVRTAVTIKPEVGDRCVGRYQLAPGAVFTVSRQGDHYFAQLTGQGNFEIFPSSDTDFFYKVVDAQLTFTPDATGNVTSLTLHQNGDKLAKRLP